MISQSEYVKVSGSLRDMLCQVCDHAHDRCVKLLIARAKVSQCAATTPLDIVCCLVNLATYMYSIKEYSSPSLIRPPFLPRNCGHIREVTFGEREK